MIYVKKISYILAPLGLKLKNGADLPEVGPVTAEDIELALRNTRPSAHLHAHRYDKFNQDYGSHVLS
jgi:hypothetical protein